MGEPIDVLCPAGCEAGYHVEDGRPTSCVGCGRPVVHRDQLSLDEVEP